MPGNTKKHWLGAVAAAFLGVAFLWNPHLEILSVPAAGAVNLTGDVSDVIFTVSTYALELGKFVAWVCFAFLTYLLDPRFIFDLGGGDDFLNVLRSIWQLSRDLMNVMFAIMLVFAALYVIVMNKKDFIQEHIAKFVIAVVFVNFSWFFPRVLLDVSAVLTSTIYGIPSLLGSECISDDEEVCMAATSILFLPSDDKRNQLDEGDGWNCHMSGFICVQLKPLSSSNVSQASAVLNGLIINHGRLIKLGEIPPPDLSGGNFTDKALFAMRQGIILLIVIALVFPLIAMCIAFFLRIPMLWLTVAFMPFYFLDLVGGEKISQGYGKKIWENFLSAAFLPALVAIPLTVGFILLNAGDQIAFQSLDNVPFRLLDGVSTLHEVMWLFLALAVMWTGVFGVLKKQEIIGKGAERVEGFGKELGKLAINTPLSIPLVPGITGGGPTLNGLLTGLKPSNINAALKYGTPLKDVIAKVGQGNNAGAGTPLAQKVDKGVTKIINGGAPVINKFNIEVKELSEAKNAAEVDKIAKNIITELGREGIVADRSNLADVLKLIKENPKVLGKDNLKIDDKAIQNLRTPPGAPAPAPVAPPPPPGPPTPP